MRNSNVRPRPEVIAILVVLAAAVHAGGKDESAKQWSKPKRVTFAHKQVALSAVLKDLQTAAVLFPRPFRQPHHHPAHHPALAAAVFPAVAAVVAEAAAGKNGRYSGRLRSPLCSA